MKKKIFILLLGSFLMISNINAECNTSERNELKSLAQDITYEKSYSMSDKVFTIKFYNVFPGLLLRINGSIYSGNSNDNYSVELTNLVEGTRVSADVLETIGCDETLNTLFITLPYYNTFYGTQKCEKYIGKLTQCTSQFLSYELSESILDSAIESLGNEIKPDIPDKPVKKTFFQKAYEVTKTFLMDWGISIGLFIFFGVITAIIGEKIFRKTKHGI